MNALTWENKKLKIDDTLLKLENNLFWKQLAKTYFGIGESKVFFVKLIVDNNNNMKKNCCLLLAKKYELP